MSFSIKYLSAFISLAVSSFLLTTSVTFAQSTHVFSGLDKSVAGFAGIVSKLALIVVTLIFVSFVWNLVKYINSGGDSEGAKKNMGWSLLAVVVVTSIWGIIAFIRDIVGVDGNAASNSITIPGVNFN